MKNYQWVLFDADETLFHFDAFSGLKLLFSRFNKEFSRANYRAYQEINKALWTDYQNNLITPQQLQQKRFQPYADELGVSAEDLGIDFLRIMTEICTPLPGAISLLNALKPKTKLGIITNGFIQFQQTRLERMGVVDHFDVLVISEEVGFPKPHPAIFDHAISLMGNPKREQVLMVGDNPSSDILGGINAGMDTCWLNVDKQPIPKNIKPHYNISSLTELERLLTF